MHEIRELAAEDVWAEATTLLNKFDGDSGRTRNIVLWGAGKRFQRIIREYVVERQIIDKPKYFVDSVRPFQTSVVEGISREPFETLKAENPNVTTVVITAGMLDLQAQIIRNELYYFDIVHIRSIEAAVYVAEHLQDLRRNLEALEDSHSRYVYLQALRNVIRGVMFDSALYSSDPYFGNGLIDLPSDGSIVFAGAFNGKHLRRIRAASPGIFIHAFEPSPKWSATITEEFRDDNRCFINNVLIGDRMGNVNYDPDDENNGLAARIEGEASARTVTLPQTTLDNYFSTVGDGVGGSLKQIALDVEGAEQPTLIGAAETIRNYLPVLTVCLYHSAADYIQLPHLIEQIAPGKYSFQVRQHSPISAIETVLYAIPISSPA